MAIEEACGKDEEGIYSRTAKIAQGVLVWCLVMGGRRKKELTWNDHCAAAHDADDLHRTELLEAHLLTLEDGDAEFDNEDEAEIPDGKGLRNESSIKNPLPGEDIISHDLDGIFNHENEAKGDGQRCNAI